MRSQRGAVWPYLLLSVALLGALGFGWYQTRLNQQYAQEIENKYMSAFHKLKWTSENIEERTAKLMATNNPELQESLLADLRVFSAQAVEHMSVLPFLTVDTPRIQQFLNTLRERSDELHHKVSQGESLTEEDWNQLAELRKQSVVFEEQLSNVLGLVGNNMIRWRDTVKTTSLVQTGDSQTPITKSVLELDKALQSPPGEENATQPGNMGPLPRPRTHLGPRVDEATARKAVKEFIGEPLTGEPVLTGNSDPADEEKLLSLYFFDAKKQDGTPLNFGVSIHGGHVIYMIDGRPVQSKQFTKEQLVERAMERLREWGYPPVVFVSAAENDGTMVMDFAPLKDGVAIETELIRVMLAMDKGDLVGFDAKSYWINKHDRDLPAPQISAEEAQQRISPRLQVEAEPVLSLIADRREQERLVWRVLASYDGQQYRVFVDALTGEEVEVQRVAGDPAPPMNEG